MSTREAEATDYLESMIEQLGLRAVLSALGEIMERYGAHLEEALDFESQSLSGEERLRVARASGAAERMSEYGERMQAVAESSDMIYFTGELSSLFASEQPALEPNLFRPPQSDAEFYAVRFREISEIADGASNEYRSGRPSGPEFYLTGIDAKAREIDEYRLAGRRPLRRLSANRR